MLFHVISDPLVLLFGCKSAPLNTGHVEDVGSDDGGLEAGQRFLLATEQSISSC